MKSSKFSITNRISRLVSRAEVRGCVWGKGNGGAYFVNVLNSIKFTMCLNPKGI
jgi:hypothetical protein